MIFNLFLLFLSFLFEFSLVKNVKNKIVLVSVKTFMFVQLKMSSRNSRIKSYKTSKERKTKSSVMKQEVKLGGNWRKWTKVEKMLEIDGHKSYTNWSKHLQHLQTRVKFASIAVIKTPCRAWQRLRSKVRATKLNLCFSLINRNITFCVFSLCLLWL